MSLPDTSSGPTKDEETKQFPEDSHVNQAFEQDQLDSEGNIEKKNGKVHDQTIDVIQNRQEVDETEDDSGNESDQKPDDLSSNQTDISSLEAQNETYLGDGNDNHLEDSEVTIDAAAVSARSTPSDFDQQENQHQQVENALQSTVRF